MKFSDLKVGMKVYDRWWPWQVFIVAAVLKTRARLRRGATERIQVYDRAHVQFLEPAQGSSSQSRGPRLPARTHRSSARGVSRGFYADLGPRSM